MNTQWNRSSAFSPEVLGILNTATEATIADAIKIFEKAADGLNLSDEQHAEAIQLLASGVTEGMSKFIEKLKANGVSSIDCGTI